MIILVDLCCYCSKMGIGRTPTATTIGCHNDEPSYNYTFSIAITYCQHEQLDQLTDGKNPSLIIYVRTYMQWHQCRPFYLGIQLINNWGSLRSVNVHNQPRRVSSSHCPAACPSAEPIPQLQAVAGNGARALCSTAGSSRHISHLQNHVGCSLPRTPNASRGRPQARRAEMGSAAVPPGSAQRRCLSLALRVAYPTRRGFSA